MASGPNEFSMVSTFSSIPGSLDTRVTHNPRPPTLNYEGPTDSQTQSIQARDSAGLDTKKRRSSLPTSYPATSITLPNLHALTAAMIPYPIEAKSDFGMGETESETSALPCSRCPPSAIPGTTQAKWHHDPDDHQTQQHPEPHRGHTINIGTAPASAITEPTSSFPLVVPLGPLKSSTLRSTNSDNSQRLPVSLKKSGRKAVKAFKAGGREELAIRRDSRE
ncbi:hypothetical protein K474DRAFT_1707847 [Panus rudis PR-1116 ss-1]|nr:hypothetical protein K474DRAFT_1707847 [Panus rudis PR-1116 ss-1]